jgi:hypothetical protein
VLVLAACLSIVQFSPAASFRRAGAQSPVAQGAGNRPPQEPAPISRYSDPHPLWEALNALRPDGEHVYEVENLTIERDVIRIRLEEGKLAFFQPIDGHVTGAVFSGRGHVIATPREAGERRSLAQFLGVPILDSGFNSAYFRFTDGTAEDLHKQLEEAIAEDSADAQFSENWARVAQELNPDHSVRILEDLLSNNPLPYFSATLAGGAKGPVELSVDLRRGEPVLIGQPRIANGENVFDVWASFLEAESRGVEAARSTVTFRPIDYQVETTIASDLSLTGTTSAHLRAARNGERVLPLELSKDLAVETAMEGAKPLAFFQNQNLSAREIRQRGNNLVYVVLPEGVKEGDELKIDISYHGSVIRDAGNGVFYVGERGAWYAHVPDLGFFTPFDLTFHWPKRLTLVATGIAGKETDEGEVRTGHWRSEKPFAVAGFNLGEYTSQSLGTAPVVRIYANRELETAILSRLRPGVTGPVPSLPTFIAPNIQGRDAMEMQRAESVSSADVIRQLGNHIESSIQFYEKLNGPFPFPEMQVSPIPGSFGQGWPGLIYLSTLAFLPPEAQVRAGLGGKTQELAREILPFHEVAHQWWGNVASAASYRDVWIEEGMATYQSLMYADSQKPGAKRLENWLADYRNALLQKPPGKNEPIEQSGPLTLGYRLTTTDNPEAYDVIVYDKGAWVIHMLRELMRDEKSKLPEARFHAFLESVLSDYAYQPLTTQDFERAAERQMTPSMDLDGSGTLRWFFEEWVRGTGIPRYSVRFETRPSGKAFVVYGTLTQNDVDETFVERIPLFASVGKGKLEFLGNVVSSGQQTRFRFVAGAKPEKIIIDARMTVLCTTD